MFCPQCGINQSEELKFCKSCGANLHAVRQVITTRETGEKFDWSKTWVAEMLLSADEQKKRKLERQRSISPEEKKYNEIKAGVMTSSVGIGVMIFLYVFMKGVILGGNIPPNAIEIISRVWVVGAIPFFVGLGLLINGLLVSKKMVESANRELQGKETPKALDSIAERKEEPSLPSAEWYESDSPRPSVTENTTRQLGNSSTGNAIE